MHNVRVFLSYTDEFDEDATMEFVLSMRYVPRIGDRLSFEAPPGVGTIDQIDMGVTGVTESFFLTDAGSRPCTEVEAVNVDKVGQLLDTDHLKKALRAHSVVSEIDAS